MKLKISPLTILLFAALTVLGDGGLYVIAYLVMLIHEFAHLIAACFIGLKPEHIELAPFGVNLRLKCKIISSTADEIILYSAGPLVNALLAGMALYMGKYDFYKMNTALFILNLLPVIPFDGGMIVLRLCSAKFGAELAKKLLNIFSAIIGSSFFILACAGLLAGYINASLFIIAIFLLGNLITGKGLYDTDFISAISNRRKKSNRAKVVIIDDSNSPIKAIKSLSPSFTTIAVMLDSQGRIKEIKSEYEIIDSGNFFD